MAGMGGGGAGSGVGKMESTVLNKNLKNGEKTI